MCAERLPSITIVIPARNEEVLIGQCLESIRSQDYPGELVEVIVVDDSSDDATQEIARRHGGVTDTVLLGFLLSRKGLRFALTSAFRRTS